MEPSVWDLLRGKNRLTEMEYSVLLFAAENVSLVREMNIRELAARCYTSPATIIRLCKKLGFSGYSEFLFFLKGQQPTLQQTERPHHEAWADQFRTHVTNFERTDALISEQVSDFRQLLDASRSIFFIRRRLFHVLCRIYGEEAASSKEAGMGQFGRRQPEPVSRPH
ncbi:hypothetical protein [Exiguobacterium sp. s194]|uniref:MurR/RpiR family transcriptional regulator n=1 Tax=Exiguobacterium sp. s194 TaxID=2751230 RepID=UPI0020373D95|nr:hypothetical protein [Exiguobacterium sp. s194]